MASTRARPSGPSADQETLALAPLLSLEISADHDVVNRQSGSLNARVASSPFAGGLAARVHLPPQACPNVSSRLQEDVASGMIVTWHDPC